MKPNVYIAIFIFLILNIQPIDATGQGFTVTSVSTSEVFTKITDPSTVYWIINVQIDGGGQSITGTIDPSTIKNFMNGKVYTNKNFRIDINSANEQVVYDIIDEGVRINKYQLESFDAPQSCPLGLCYRTGDPQQCSNADWNIELGKTFFGHTIKRYCVTKQQEAIKGVYQNPLIKFDANIRLDVGDIVKEKTICSGSTLGCDGSSVSFDDVGTATWTGSLVTGEPAPNQNNFVAINRFNSNRWQIVSKSSFEYYLPSALDADSRLNSLANLFKNYGDVGAGDREINNVISSINVQTDNLLMEDSSFTSSPTTKDSNTGRITINLERKLTSQNIVFRIRADKVGIYIPSGQPKILDIKTSKFRSGEEGKIEIQVQNTGDAQGTFTAKLENCDLIIQTTSSQTSRKTLQPGDIDTIPLIISGGNVSEDITRTCSVKVYDINDPDVLTSSNVNIQLQKPRICDPNQEFADGNTIKRCNKDGTIIDIVENCKYGIEHDKKGNIVCKKPEPSDLVRAQLNDTKIHGDVKNACNIVDNIPGLLSVFEPIGIIKQTCALFTDPKELILNGISKFWSII